MSSSEAAKRKNKRPAPDPVTIPFKIAKHEVVDKREVLMLTKSDCPAWDRGSGVKEPVSRICVSAANVHAFNIMLNLNHTNIRWMKAIGKFDGQLSTFVEPCNQNLYPGHWVKFIDTLNQIPSPVLQLIIRELIEVIDFLRRNDTYHGMLNWETTFYREPYTVKASGFQPKDHIDKIQAQWEDWTDIKEMLQTISNRARVCNEKSSVMPLTYGDVDGLVHVIANSNIAELPSMKDKVLENPFFWTKAKRFNIMLNRLPILLNDPDFRRMISCSNICQLPWDSNSNNRFLTQNLEARFKALLKKCNRYRLDLNTKNEYSMPSTAGLLKKEGEEEIKEFCTDRKMDLVSLAYACYTHADELQENVDYVFRAKFPKFFSELHNVMGALTQTGG